MNSDQVSLGVATEVIVLITVGAMILLFVGIVVLIIVYVYITARVLSVTISSGGGRGVIDNRVMEEISTSSRMFKDELENLPSFEYIKTSSVVVDDDCAVCLDSYNVGDKCRLLPVCNHKFHAHCVDKWLMTTPICPICRTTTTAVTSASVSTRDLTHSAGSVSNVEESESQQSHNVVIELS